MFPYNRKLTTFQTKEDRFLESKGWLLPGRDKTHQKSNFLQEKVFNFITISFTKRFRKYVRNVIKDINKLKSIMLLY